MTTRPSAAGHGLGIRGNLLDHVLRPDRGRSRAAGAAALHQGAARRQRLRRRLRRRRVRVHRACGTADRRQHRRSARATDRRPDRIRVRGPRGDPLLRPRRESRCSSCRGSASAQARGWCSRPAPRGWWTSRREERRGRVIGLYGLSVWTALSVGPPLGDLLYRRGRFRRGMGVRDRRAGDRGRDRDAGAGDASEPAPHAPSAPRCWRARRWGRAARWRSRRGATRRLRRSSS